MNWYLKSKEVEYGPFSFELLLKIVKNNKVSKTDLVRNDSNPEQWISISDMDILTNIIEAEELTGKTYMFPKGGFVWTWSQIVIPTIGSAIIALFFIILNTTNLFTIEYKSSPIFPQQKIEKQIVPIVAKTKEPEVIIPKETAPVITVNNNIPQPEIIIPPVKNEIETLYCFYPNILWTEKQRESIRIDLDDYIEGLPDHAENQTTGRSTLWDNGRLYQDKLPENREKKNGDKEALRKEQYLVIQRLNDLGKMVPDVNNPRNDYVLDFMNFEWGHTTKNIKLSFDVTSDKNRQNFIRAIKGTDAELHYHNGTKKRVVGTIGFDGKQLEYIVPTMSLYNINRIMVTIKQ